MRRLLPSAALFALTLIALTVVTHSLSSTAPEAPRAARPAAPVEAPRATPAPAEPAPAPVAERARYRLTYAAEWTIDGRAQAPMQLSALWDTRPAPDGGLLVRISEAELAEHELLPTADTLEGVYALEGRDGALRRVGFPAGADGATRRIVATLAETFWMTPGAGPAWVVEEDTVGGRQLTRYQRRGGAGQAAVQTVEKTVERILGVWGPHGLDARPAAGMTPVGQARFELDADGLRRVTVAAGVDIDPGEGMPQMQVRVTAELRRLDAEPPAFAGRITGYSPVGRLVDHRSQKAEMDDTLIDGADAAALIADLGRAEALGRDSKAGREGRATALRRMAALVRQDATAAATLADALRQRAADGEPTGALAGALVSSRTAAGTNALAELVGELDGPHKQNAINTLGVAPEPTPESLAVLTDEMQADPAAAAMAAGSQARALADEAPEQARSVVEQLIDGYRAAATDAERLLYIKALGNTGDVQALPIMVAATAQTSLRDHALRGMRFIPGADADAALLPWVQAYTAHTAPALQAVAYRDAAAWVPALTTARAVYAELGERGAPAVAAYDAVIAHLQQGAPQLMAQPEG